MRVYLETYGCWLNKALSNAIEQLVVEEGGELVSSPEEADVIIVNTCAVRAESERRVLRRLEELGRLNARIAIVGCLVNVRPYTILSAVPRATLLEPSALGLTRRFLKGEDLVVVRKYEGGILVPKYRGGVRYVVPIETGCTGNCGFCVEPIVRGRGVQSLEPNLVLELVEEAVRKGAKEVYLTGQDVAAYGLDRGTDLAALLEAILEEIEGDYRVRLGMMEPWLASRFAERLGRLMRDERVYKYLHLPVQSGDDGVLRLMGRRYRVAEYEHLVYTFRELVEEVSVVTDIIVGYPGESYEAFERSVELVESLMFDKVHVARYTFRPFTKAYIAECQVPEPEKKRRSRILSRIALRVAYEVNRSYLGKVFEVLVTDRGVKPGTFIARTDTYKPVALSASLKIGERVKVRIAEASPTHLVGEVLD